MQYQKTVTYRQVGADPVHTQKQVLTGNQSTFITVTVRVHPSLPTYITLKMYGSDNQTCAIMLFWRSPQQPPIESLYPGMISIGSGLLQLGNYTPGGGTQAGGYGPIELVNRGMNSYPRHFHYSSSVLGVKSYRQFSISPIVLFANWRSTPRISPIGEHDNRKYIIYWRISY
jgi:hypothetical protein